MKGLLVAAVLALTPVTAYAEKNDKYHVGIGALTAAMSSTYFNKYRQQLTPLQKVLRTYRNCVLVGGGLEIFQGVSGTGVADFRDVGTTLIGCAAVRTTIDLNRWFIRGGKKR